MKSDGKLKKICHSDSDEHRRRNPDATKKDGIATLLRCSSEELAMTLPVRRLSTPAFFIIFFVSIFCLAISSTDAATSLSKNELTINETFTITGENFGPANATSSFVCFTDTSHCIRGSNFGEHAGWSWSDTSVTLQVPTEIVVAGDVFVYIQGKKEECFPDKGYCTISTFLDEKGKASYRIIPKVFQIKPGPSAKKGETITIEGSGFGTNPGEIYLDTYLAPIKSWQYGVIEIGAPDQISGSTKKITIKSTSGLQVTKDYRVAVGVSADEFSYLQAYLEQIYAREAWQLAGSGEVIVAVLDDGVLIDHPDLAANIWTNAKEVAGNGIDDDFNGFIDDVHGYNFLDTNTIVDPKGFHGTAVAGIIGAVRDNAVGIGGLVKNVKIMPIVVADAKGVTNSTIVDRAIHYAADNGAHIINLSFSTTGENGFFPQLDIPIQYAFDKGSVVVAAAGNGDVDTGIGINVNSRPQTPVCNTKRGSIAIGVAALNNLDVESGGKKIAKWSNYGNNCVSIAAPGTRLYTTVPAQFHKEGKLYASESGTSFATPIVAAAAALLKATFPLMRPGEIILRLLSSADPIDDFNPDVRSQIGGQVNIYRALAAGKPMPTLDSFAPLSVQHGENVQITIRNYDLGYRVVFTQIQGGADFILPSEQISSSNGTFIFVVPSSFAPGSYRLRILSSINEELSVSSDVLVVHALPAPIIETKIPSPALETPQQVVQEQEVRDMPQIPSVPKSIQEEVKKQTIIKKVAPPKTVQPKKTVPPTKKKVVVKPKPKPKKKVIPPPKKKIAPKPPAKKAPIKKK